MSFYSEMERIIKDQGDAGIDHLMYYYGLKLELHRPEKSSTYSRVHGPNAGTNTEKIKEFTGILHGDDFFPSNDQYSGGFIGGFLYAREKAVMVGDIIKVAPKDGKTRRYKIIKREQLGLTTEVFSKWVLSAIGD